MTLIYDIFYGKRLLGNFYAKRKRLNVLFKLYTRLISINLAGEKEDKCLR